MENYVSDSSKGSYHFIGIGGIGMSSLASMLLRKGHKVSGSDIYPSSITKELAKNGATIYIEHSGKNIQGNPLVVYSSAILEDNPERIEASKQNLTIIQRAELLSSFFNIKKGIAIAGTHGKTTTTALTTLILKKAGLDPDAFIGGEVPSLDGNFVCGEGEYVIAEADESDGSFLNLNPFYSIVTNIEGEHFGFYKNVKEIISIFRKFINQTSSNGAVYLNIDNANTKTLYDEYKGRKISYSIYEEADICACKINLKSCGSRFKVIYRNVELGEMEFKIPGLHNVSNSLGAIALATDIGADFSTIKEALWNFSGVRRRFEIKGEIENIVVIDDYAHHPTEIAATISSAKSLEHKKRLIGIFQPHRYSRTMYLKNEFANAFNGLDMLILTDIYAACEEPIEGIDGKTILDGVVSSGMRNVEYIPDVLNIPEYICEKLVPGDVVLTMGAGNITKISDIIVEKLQRRAMGVR